VTPFRVTEASIPIMDQEIKISVSKRHLTYYVMSVIVVLTSLAIGYQLGLMRSRALVRPQTARPMITRAQAELGQTKMLRQTQSLHNQQEGIMSSDPSWQAKVPPNATTITNSSASLPEPIENIYRYYEDDSQLTKSSTVTTSQSTGEDYAPIDARSFVASKNGTKYYPVGCKSANRIKDENKIYFATAQEAELEGLTPAATC